MTGSKSQIDVNERRLRPVYDALDGSNNKQAIKLVDQILKKQKDLVCAKALKSLALIRSNRAEEGGEILEEIKLSDDEFDESTLQAMTMCYKETNKPHGIVSIYELAVRRSPKNEEFISHLFMSFVRVGNFVKQQQVAMSLYKLVPKNPYYFWAVMSIFMQASEAATSEGKKRGMLLSLAEKMVEKFVKDDKIDSEEEIRLYLLILERQDKYEEALGIIRGTFGDMWKGTEKERQEIEGEYLVKLSRWAEANVLYKLVLRDNADQWSYYVSYVRSFFELRHWPESSAPIDFRGESHTLHATFSAVDAYCEQLCDENPLFRGPRLARMYLVNEIVKKDGPLQDGVDLHEKLIELVLSYFEFIGHKPCFYTDVRNFADHLSTAEARAKFSEQLTNSQPSDSVNIKDTLQRSIGAQCLLRRLGCHDDFSGEQKLEKVSSLMQMFWRASEEQAAPQIEAEARPGDPLVALAVYLLNDLNREAGSDVESRHALLLLEEAATSSKFYAQFQLLLIYFYSRLGVHSPCARLMEQIDVKYIMYDSMGYFLSGYAYTSGQFQAADRFYDASISFFNSSQKDTPEQILAAYKFGSFRQVPEMVTLKNRLLNSSQFCLMRIEKLNLDVLKFSNSILEIKAQLIELKTSMSTFKLNVEVLCDNRDFLALDDFDPVARSVTDEVKSSTYKQNLLWVRFRYNLVNALAICYEEASGSGHTANGSLANGDLSDNKENTGVPVEIPLERIERELREIIVDVREMKDVSRVWENPHHSPPCQIFRYVDSGFHDITLPLIACANTLIAGHPPDTQQVGEQLTSVADRVTEVCGRIERNMLVSQCGVEVFNGQCLPDVVYALESCNYIAVFVHLLRELIQQKHGRKKGKKKKEGPSNALNGILVQLNEVCSTVGTCLQKTLDKLTDARDTTLEQQLDAASLDALFRGSSKSSEMAARIDEKTRASFQQSLEEITQIMRFKIELLRALNT